MDDDELLLIDSDLFILLSASGLLDRVVELLGFSIKQVRCLSALPHMLRKPNRSWRRKYPQQILDRALIDVNRIVSLSDRPDSDETFDRLIKADDDMDGGEALLYTTLCERNACLLGSGDKRAMKVLGAMKDLSDIRQQVAGRVVSLEVVCELLLKADDVAEITEAFLPLCDVNQTLIVLFGSGRPFTTKDRLEAVASYRRDFEKAVGRDFLYRIDHH